MYALWIWRRRHCAFPDCVSITRSYQIEVLYQTTTDLPRPCMRYPSHWPCDSHSFTIRLKFCSLRGHHISRRYTSVGVYSITMTLLWSTHSSFPFTGTVYPTGCAYLRGGSSLQVQVCQKLGLVINLDTLDLIPSQVATNLGMLCALPGHQTRGRLRVTNWLTILEGFMVWESPRGYKFSVRVENANNKWCAAHMCPPRYQSRGGPNHFRWSP